MKKMEIAREWGLHGSPDRRFAAVLLRISPRFSWKRRFRFLRTQFPEKSRCQFSKYFRNCAAHSLDNRSKLDNRSLLDTDLCWTQIYVGHRSVLDTDLSWTIDLRWSTGPSWTTFSTIFGLFPTGPRSVPGLSLIHI